MKKSGVLRFWKMKLKFWKLNQISKLGLHIVSQTISGLTLFDLNFQEKIPSYWNVETFLRYFYISCAHKKTFLQLIYQWMKGKFTDFQKTPFLNHSFGIAHGKQCSLFLYFVEKQTVKQMLKLYDIGDPQVVKYFL